MGLKVYWFGYGGSSWMVERLRFLIEDELGMTLITIHEHPNANIKWDINTVYPELENADIIVIPANYRRQPCKSSNRLTQAMALGKAIICEPMPSYIPIAKNLDNCIILNNDSIEQWRFALSLLKENSVLRKNLGKRALIDSKKYSTREISHKWINLLNSIDTSTDSIDVVIPTKNNIDILRECLKSFSNSSKDEFVYIIDNDVGSDKVDSLVKELGLELEIRDI